MKDSDRLVLPLWSLDLQTIQSLTHQYKQKVHNNILVLFRQNQSHAPTIINNINEHLYELRNQSFLAMICVCWRLIKTVITYKQQGLGFPPCCLGVARSKSIQQRAKTVRQNSRASYASCTSCTLTISCDPNNYCNMLTVCVLMQTFSM